MFNRLLCWFGVHAWEPGNSDPFTVVVRCKHCHKRGWFL